MKKCIVILQPSYLPWLGYFDQIAKSDVFVFYDDVMYTKNDWRNRNRIKTPQGIQWLTLPVRLSHRLTDQLLIKDVVIADPDATQKHLKRLELYYKKAPFFKEVYSLLSPILSQSLTSLSKLDIDLTQSICHYLGINHVTFLKSSDLSIKGENPTDRLVNICVAQKATHYLTGASAVDYLDEKQFAHQEVVIEYQNYAHPTYHQLWGEFVPYLSIVDVLFNEGRKSLKILTNT